MRKLRLNPDTLAVDTFAPAAEDPALRGTVRGNEALADTGLYNLPLPVAPQHRVLWRDLR